MAVSSSSLNVIGSLQDLRWVCSCVPCHWGYKSFEEDISLQSTYFLLCFAFLSSFIRTPVSWKRMCCCINTATAGEFSRWPPSPWDAGRWRCPHVLHSWLSAPLLLLWSSPWVYKDQPFEALLTWKNNFGFPQPLIAKGKKFLHCKLTGNLTHSVPSNVLMNALLLLVKNHFSLKISKRGWKDPCYRFVRPSDLASFCCQKGLVTSEFPGRALRKTWTQT